MTTEKLMKFLQRQEGKDFILDLQGIITTIIYIKQIRVKKEKDMLVLEDEKRKTTNIGLKLNQLMKISQVPKSGILLEFDPLQSVMIIIL